MSIRNQRLRHLLYSVVILLTFFGLCYCFFASLGAIDVFQGLLSKTGIYLTTRGLYSGLLKVGCSSPLAFVLVFAVKVLINEYAESIKMMAPTGSDSGASTSFPKLEGERALDLPENQIAPECLQSHIKEQLRYLFNIGRKKTLSENIFQEFIEPLAFDRASVGFAKALLERVDTLQLEHYNNGQHIRFEFNTKKDKEKLYSIMWQYGPKE